MFSSLLSNLPSFKTYITHILEKYVGIHLDISSFCLDEEKNLFIQLENVEMDTAVLNKMALESSPIKVFKATLNNLTLKLSFSEFNIKINGLNLLLMPMKNPPKRRKLSKVKENKNIIRHNSHNSHNSTEEEAEEKGFMDNIADIILSKLLVTVEDVNVYLLNYESNRQNWYYINPCISVHVPYIVYDRNNKDLKDEDNIVNFWQNKYLKIAKIVVKLEKNFSYDEAQKKDKNEEEKEENSVESEELYRDDIDLTANSVLLTFNPEKQIRFFTDETGNINGSLGDLQIILSTFQLELIKNFLEVITNINNEIESIIKNSEEHEEYSHKTNILPMNVKIEFNSISVIIYENSFDTATPKINFFTLDEMRAHFCYCEDNYYLFLVTSITLNIDKKLSGAFKIGNVLLDYIEYRSREDKKDASAIRCSSVYSSCAENFVFEGEVFNSVNEDCRDKNLRAYTNYTFNYNVNEIVFVDNILLKHSIEAKKSSIDFSLSQLKANVHPVFLFKILRFLYDTTGLVNNIIFCNQEKRKEWAERKKEEQEMMINPMLVDEDDFDDCETIEEDASFNDVKKTRSDSILEKKLRDLKLDEKIRQKEKAENNLKKFFKKVNISLSVDNIEIRVHTFEADDKHASIITPYFAEFYYENIYPLEVKGNYARNTLDLNSITNKDSFFLIKVSGISVKINDQKEGIISNVNVYFGSKVIFQNQETLKIFIDIDNVEVTLAFKIAVKLELLNVNKIISFVNVWLYSLDVFEIFQGRMMACSEKTLKELCTMYQNKTNDTLNIVNDEKNSEPFLEKMKINIKIETTIIEMTVLKNAKNLRISPLFQLDSINLSLILEPNAVNVCLKVDKICEKNDVFSIKDIALDLKMEDKILKENSNFNNKVMQRKSEAAKIKLINNIIPSQDVCNFIRRVKTRLKTRQSREERIADELNSSRSKLLTTKNKDDLDFLQKETSIELLFKIKSVNINAVESILYVNDFYNVVLKEEVFKQSLIPFSSENIKKSESDSLLSDLNETKSTTSEVDDAVKAVMLLNVGEVKGDTSTKIKFKIILDQFELSFPGLEEQVLIVGVHNLTFKNYKLAKPDKGAKGYFDGKLNQISVNIKYTDILDDNLAECVDTKKFDPKKPQNIFVDVFSLENLQFMFEEGRDTNVNYYAIISRIYAGLCQDSRVLIEKFLNDLLLLLDQCFKEPDKNNKIKLSANIKDTKDISKIEMVDTNKNEHKESKITKIKSLETCSELIIYEDYLDNFMEKYNNMIDNGEEYYALNDSVASVDRAKLKSEKKEKLANPSTLLFKLIKLEVYLYEGNDLLAVPTMKEKSEANEHIPAVNYDEDFNKDSYKNINNSPKNQKSCIGGLNFEEIKDCSEVNEKIKKFEVLDVPDHINLVSGRDKEHYILLELSELSLDALYKDINFQLNLTLKKLEIFDQLKVGGDFKIIFSEATKDSVLTKEIDDQEKNENLLNLLKKQDNYVEIFVDIANEYHEDRQVTDTYIICQIGLLPLELMLHQAALKFILNMFFEKKSILAEIKKDNDESFKFFSKSVFAHTGKDYLRDVGFNEVEIDKTLTNVNNSVEPQKSRDNIYIKKFILKEFFVFITYEATDFSFSFKDITIPVLPGFKDFVFNFPKLSVDYYVHLEMFTDILISKFVNQLSKYSLVVDLFKSLGWTGPIVRFFSDLIDIFIAPFNAIRNQTSIADGLLKGVKKFFFNFLRGNIYAGEKIVRVITTFIGFSKSSKVGKDGFYGKYFMSEEKRKLHNYYYKS